MRRTRFFYGGWLLIFLPQILFAQSWRIEKQAGLGRDLKNDLIFPEIKQGSVFLNLSLTKNMSKRGGWQEEFNFPELHLNHIVMTLGNLDVFGTGYAFAPSLRQWFDKKHHWFNEYGFGGAWVTKPHGTFSNPADNIVGSHLNMYVLLRIGHQWYGQQHSFSLALSYLHFSNARVKVPNIGLNIPTINFSVSNSTESKENRQAGKHLPAPQKLHFGFHAGIGLGSRILDIGPVYENYVGTAYIGWAFRRKSALYLGADYVFNMSVYNYQRTHEIEKGETYAWSATRIAAFVGFEYFYEHFSLHAQGGPYLHNTTFSEGDYLVKVGFQYYYFNTYHHRGPNPFIGTFVQTYFGDAEFGELAAGILF